MKELDTAVVTGVEAAIMFEDLARSNLLLAAHKAEEYLNSNCLPDFAGFAVSSFNLNSRTSVAARIVLLCKNRIRIVVYLEPPFEAAR